MFRAIKHNVDITVKYLPMETGCFAAVYAFAEPCVCVCNLWIKLKHQIGQISAHDIVNRNALIHNSLSQRDELQ